MSGQPDSHQKIDSVQARLIEYANAVRYADLPAEVVHAAKARIIDTLGVLIGGFFGEPSRIARSVATAMPVENGATIIGTRIKTSPDMAAFANNTCVAYPVMTDSYHQPGGNQGHASETVAPLLVVGEYAETSGRDFITSVVLGYEVFLRFSDTFHNPGFDNTNFGTIANAVAAGKLLKLSSEQLAHAISMAAVPNNILKQIKKDHLSMFRSAAPGHAGRAAIFAAMLARAGMEGPHLPFEGKAGWNAHIACEPISLAPLERDNMRFKILDTLIKTRPCEGNTISSVLAAEKIGPLKDVAQVKKIRVETYQKAKDRMGTFPHLWNPGSREQADHSIPYVVTAALIDGRLTLRSFNEARLWDPALRTLMQKVEVIAHDEFTRSYEKIPVEHRTRVTVEMQDGKQLVGESGGDGDEFTAPKSDAQIEEKFRAFTEEVLGTQRVSSILEYLWHLDGITNVAEIPPMFALD